MCRNLGRIRYVVCEAVYDPLHWLKQYLIFEVIRMVSEEILYNLNGSNTDGLFTVDDSNSFFSPYKILPIAQENKYLGIFFLFYHGIVYCLYSLELPH